jgi:hypothetical protein
MNKTNPHVVIAEIVRRLPAMAEDTPVNNETLLASLLQPLLEKYPCTIGVGCGFVHGEYEAVKRVQQIILELEESRRQPGGMDSIRLARLGDPDFEFKYSITADGKVNLSPLADPKKKDKSRRYNTVTLDTIFSAVDFARCEQGENPFCIRCSRALNESHAGDPDDDLEKARGLKRFTCFHCKTSFLWQPSS